MRIRCLQPLASALHERYNLLSQVDDLEQSILYHTEAIFLLPYWNRNFPSLNLVQNFLNTAYLLLLRASHTKQPEDVKHTLTYLRYLHGMSLETFNISPIMVKENLVRALALQVCMELGDAMQDIEEMAVLTLELLDSDISTISAGIITFLGDMVELQHGKWRKGKELPAKVIDCLRKVKNRLPDSHTLSITLAGTLLHRFRIAYSKGDYEEGTAILDRFLTSHAPGDDPRQYRASLGLVAAFAHVRLFASWKPEHMEEAIYRYLNLLPWIHLEDPVRPYVVLLLTSLQSTHFEDFGVGGVQEGHSWDTVLSGQPSFWDLISSFQSPSMATDDQRAIAISSAVRITNMAEIEQAIGPCRLLLASFHPGHMFRSAAVVAMGGPLQRAFLFTTNIEYLNEAISTFREDLNLPSAAPSAGLLHKLLIDSLSIRFDLQHSREDLAELMHLYQMACDDRGISDPERFAFSCKWAQLARIHSHPSTSIAYDHALSSMRDSLTFAPTVGIQHFRLVAMRDAYEMLPLDCASYQVHTGQLQSAVEILERGRALIWSEMRGLRSSIDQLEHREKPPLLTRPSKA